ncbi:MAG: HNH endonuclease signature motif containing protein [Desulfosalsimonadaceae bacterium]
MKEIELTQGKVALVDDADFEYLSQWKWHAAKQPCKARDTFYAKRNVSLGGGKQKSLYMHVAIVGECPVGYERDHKDGNGLNNQRDNLRLVTHRQNAQNLHVDKSSRYPGVFIEKRRKSKWRAQVNIEGDIKFIGNFRTERLAFDAYRRAVESIGETVVQNDRAA